MISHFKQHSAQKNRDTDKYAAEAASTIKDNSFLSTTPSISHNQRAKHAAGVNRQIFLTWLLPSENAEPLGEFCQLPLL